MWGWQKFLRAFLSGQEELKQGPQPQRGVRMPEIYAGHGRMGEGLGRGQRGQGMPPGGSSPTAKTRWSQEPDWLCGSQLPQGAKKGALLAEKARVPTDCLVWGSWHTRSSGHAEPHKLPAWPLSQQSNPWYSQSTVFPKELSQDNLGSPHSCPPPVTA